MEKVDMILTGVNVVITVVSVCGALKSFKFYDKNKKLVEHTNVNKASVEIEKMLNKLPEALTATNRNRQNSRGVNLHRIMCEIGNSLHESYNTLHSCSPVEYSSELFKLENERDFELHDYINSFISGEILKNMVLDSDRFATCQKGLMEMQDYLKCKLGEIAEKLK